MKKKIKSSRGVSILEMLIALLLLSLLSAGGVAATTAVMSDYNHMGEAANAEILASTVIETISNEIRLGNDISVGPDPTETTGESLALDSAFFGENTEIKLKDNCLIAVTKDNEGNVIATKQVLSEDTYSGLHLKDLTFKRIKEGTLLGGSTEMTGRTAFEIGFTVYSDYSNELWKDSVSVAPMFE